MIWECDCGLIGTAKYFFVANSFTCLVCNSYLKPKEGFSLSFWSKHTSFKDLDEDFLVGKRKNVLEAIKVIQPCSDRMVSLFLNIPINQVTGRRFELANASIPLVIPFGDKVDEDTKKRVTLWVFNKEVGRCFDVERALEKEALL